MIAKNKRFFSLIGALFCAMIMFSQTTYKRTINNDWKFHKGDINLNISSLQEVLMSDDLNWQSVNIPHTWNNEDAIDEVPGYYRGISWYKKNIVIQPNKSETRTQLYFEGANQVTEVFVNGKSVGVHNGGYTRFNFDITEFVKLGEENIIALKVDNSHNESIAPLSADFTFFGGVYRDVYLVHQNDIHFSMEDFGSNGVYISTPQVSKEMGKVEVKSLINNKSDATKKLSINYRILDKTGLVVLESTEKVKLDKHANQHTVINSFEIKNPELWSPENPYLYTVVTEITDAKSGLVYDQTQEPLGFRWFHFDVDNGFFLNGEYLKLVGTNRHQDYLNKGNALTDEMHVSDVFLLKEMGGNFLRISHYPQDPTVLETCDRLGIIASVEIPIVNAITESEGFTENCLLMTEEMVKQNFNHPSLIIWAYMNEVLLRSPFSDKKEPERYKIYTDNVKELASKIEGKIRTLDPSRYTMIVNHGAVDSYDDAGLTDIPMLLGWNLYHGWYGGIFADFDRCLDDLNKRFPTKPLLITEYGADVHHRLHSFKPERFDYTVEYGNQYHEHYLKAIMSRNFIAGSNIWNLNDFYSEVRGYAIPNTNLKGITTLNREKKDTWWLYKTMLSKEPVVKFGQNQWRIRGGVSEEDKDFCTQPVTVYSNGEEVQLLHNNKTYISKVVDCVARFSIPFANGKNKLTATSIIDGNATVDVMEVDFRLAPNRFAQYKDDFYQLNVLLGTERIYEDRVKNIVWIPEKAYTPGSWGYLKGKKYRPKTKFGSLPSSELDIKNTKDDPVYQTQRMNLEGFYFDVPNGRYEVVLHWVEFESNVEREALAYNLGNDRIIEDASERIFDVILNGNYIEKNLNIAEKYGAEKAVSVKYQINVIDGKGVKVDFESIKNVPILNAIQLRKIQ